MAPMESSDPPVGVSPRARRAMQEITNAAKHAPRATAEGGGVVRIRIPVSRVEGEGR